MRRFEKPIVLALFGCLAIGFGALVWTASHHHRNKSAPKEQHASSEQDHSDKRSKKSSTIQINCDPNCAADNPESDGSYVNQFLRKFLNDPVSVVTLLLVGVVVVQVRDGRHSSERQLRAYVLVKTTLFRRPETEDGDDQHWPIHLVFQNSGQTPAYNVTIKAERSLGQQRPIDSIFPFSDAAEISPPSIIAPGARHMMQLGGLEPGHAKYLAAQRAEKYCSVWGKLDYIDTFGRKHFTKFQMWQSFQGIHQFGFCQVGNGTDDEFPEGWRQWLSERWMRVGKFN